MDLACLYHAGLPWRCRYARARAGSACSEPCSGCPFPGNSRLYRTQTLSLRLFRPHPVVSFDWQYRSRDRGSGAGVGKQSVKTPHSDLTDRPDSPSRSPDEVSVNASYSAFVQAQRHPAPETKVQWGAAIRESMFLVGIGHTFDLTTEAGTRDAMRGPWV